MASLREYLESLPRRRAAVGVIFRDDADRVLLVAPTYKDGWILPGGVVEADESPATGAAREVTEELGLSVPIGRLLGLGWNAPSGEDRHGSLTMDYDGGVLSSEQIDRIVLQASELHDMRFVQPSQVPDLGTPGTIARMAAALRALAAGTVVELDR